MIKKAIFFFLFSSSIRVLFAQELVPFYDREKDKWGFQDKVTRQIIIQPQFEFAVDWWKEYGIVLMNGKYGLIDRNGNKVSPFVHEYIYVDECLKCDSSGRLAAYVSYEKNNPHSAREFYIDEKCDCLPQPYYPCPPMVKMDTASTPENLKILQRAEFKYHQGEIKQALKIADQAIAADKEDASTYFWKATHMADRYELIITEDTETQYSRNEKELRDWEQLYEQETAMLQSRLASKQSDHISEDEFNAEMKLLEEENVSWKAYYDRRLKSIDSLDNFYSRWQEEGLDYLNAEYDTSMHLVRYYDEVLNRAKNQRVYYSALAAKMELSYVDKSEKKKIKKEIIRNVPRVFRKNDVSISVHPGFAVFPYQRMEANLTFGSTDFVFDKVFPVMAGYGLGYDRGIEENAESFKALFYLQPIGPLHATLNLLYVRTGSFSGFGFRPEFGFSISALTILYGYNFVNPSRFPAMRGNCVGLRLNLPVWRQNDFRKDLGNNLYRF